MNPGSNKVCLTWHIIKYIHLVFNFEIGTERARVRVRVRGGELWKVILQHERYD